MVVILLLSPPPPTPQPPYRTTTTTPTTNGCDGGSNDSSTVSTTSTGDTVIPTIYTVNKAIPLPNEATYQHYQPPQPPASTAYKQQHQNQYHHHHQLHPTAEHEQQQPQRHRCQRTHPLYEKPPQQQQQQANPQNNNTAQHSSHLRSENKRSHNSERVRYPHATSTQYASRPYARREQRRVYEERAGKMSDQQYPPRIIISPPPPPSPPPPTTAQHFQTTTTSSWLEQDTGVTTVVAPPLPPPLPKSQPPCSPYYSCWCGETQPHLHATHPSGTNPLPKPPRTSTTQSNTTARVPCSSYGGAATYKRSDVRKPREARWSVPPSQEPAATTNAYHWRQHITPTYSLPAFLPANFITPTSTKIQQMPPANASYYNYNYDNINKHNNNTNTTDYVRHVTRVNFYDVVTSQVEFEPKDDSDECDTEAITKEEEWITKKKTELTTTRQIETRVKRQLVLEDGKVVEDSGPIVSTNTTEDTDKQETETTEKRDLGIPIDSIAVATNGRTLEAPDTVDGQVAVLPAEQSKIVKKMVPRPADGLVHETNDKRVITHEEVKDYIETEDVRNLGDFSDETYVNAVNSGVENLQEVLLAAENQKQLVPLGPRIIANTTKSFKTIDSEDIEKRCLLQADGQLVTESKKTTEHEVIVDRELPEEDDHSTGSREKIQTVEASQHLYKQRDEQYVDKVVDGKVVNTEMRYAAETMQIEKDGSLERPGDWDSLSDRMRKLRRPHQKNALQQHKEATLLADRKDALTKRPLDFDREEETRKGETIKWLESHFGSESTASNDSREDAEVGGGGDIEPTKKTFFNVTIKSNQTQQTPPAPLTNGHRVTGNSAYERKQSKDHVIETHANVSNGRGKYYQGISNWTDRKEPPVNHFASKAFREDLQETVERNRLRRDKQQDSHYIVESTDNYVSREDILHQKQRQSISSQFLAKSNRNSRDRLDDLEAPVGKPVRETNVRHISGSRGDLRYSGPNSVELENNKRTFMPVKQQSQERDLEIRHSPGDFGPSSGKKYEYGEMRSRSYERTLEDTARSVGYELHNTNSLKPLPRTDTREISPEREHFETSTLGRPTVPQRRRAIENKLRQQHSVSPPPPQKVPLERQHAHSQRNLLEPPPDYSPPPRSRSSSPQVEYVNGLRNQRNYRNNIGDHAPINNYGPPSQLIGQSTSTLTRKQNQRTRFALTTPQEQTHSQSYMRPVMATQTTQTTPSTISNSTATSHKSSKMGQVIGNSLRKLVNKIRSASAERKMRMKSRSKSREQSPSQQTIDKVGSQQTTYQQYNLIDSHIGGQGGVSGESELESMPQESTQPHKNYIHAATLERNGQSHATQFKRANSADPYANDRTDTGERGPSPRQRYYLGEDPYSSTLYGKENIYVPGYVGKRKPVAARNSVESGYVGKLERNNRENVNANRREEGEFYKQRNVTTSTLGRYQRTGQNFAASTPNLNQDYRTTQTLPRKLQDHQQQPHPQHAQQQQQQQHHHHQPLHMTQSSGYQRTGQRVPTSGYSTLGHPEQRTQYHQHQQQQHNIQPQQAVMGPAKPARTYAKALNRSKSFNVHAMNGSHDPSPIYIEKLTKNNYASNASSTQQTTSNLYASQAYKSNPHLYSGPSKENSIQSGLKSPSIVNLISRSQKDLTKIDSLENEQSDMLEKKQTFMRGLHQQAPDLYRTLHGDENYPAHSAPNKYHQLRHSTSLETRSPIEINKDTASIVRRDSSSNDGYVVNAYSNKTTMESATANRRILYKDDQTRHRRTPGATIISVRNNEMEK